MRPQNKLTKIHPSVNTIVLVLLHGVLQTQTPTQKPKPTSRKTKKRECFSLRINFILPQQQFMRTFSLLTLPLHHLFPGLQIYRLYPIS